MRDEHHPVGRHAEQSRLLERLVDERLRADGGGREPAAARGEPRRAHCTTRTILSRRGPSTARSPWIATCSITSADAGLREDLLREPERLGAGRVEVVLDAVEELAAAVLRDVEQDDRPAGERAGAGRERHRLGARDRRSGSRTPSDLLRDHLGLHPVARPEDGREAARLAARNDEHDPLGIGPLRHERVVGAACTYGVVSPRRSSTRRAAHGVEDRRPHALFAPPGGGEERGVLGAERRRGRCPASATSSGSTGSPLPSRAPRRDPRACGCGAPRSRAARPRRPASRSRRRGRIRARRGAAPTGSPPRSRRSRRRACPDYRAWSGRDRPGGRRR